MISLFSSDIIAAYHKERKLRISVDISYLVKIRELDGDQKSPHFQHRTQCFVPYL